MCKDPGSKPKSVETRGQEPALPPQHWTSNTDLALLWLQPKGADASPLPRSWAQIQPEPKEPNPQQTGMVGLTVMFLGSWTRTESGS